jgi:hypothetical protein
MQHFDIHSAKLVMGDIDLLPEFRTSVACVPTARACPVNFNFSRWLAALKKV